MSAAPPPLDPPQQTFTIPPPPVLDESSEQGVRSLTQAVEERRGNQEGTLAEARRGS